MRILGDRAHFLEFLNFSVTKFSLGTLRSHADPAFAFKLKFGDSAIEEIPGLPMGGTTALA